MTTRDVEHAILKHIIETLHGGEWVTNWGALRNTLKCSDQDPLLTDTLSEMVRTQTIEILKWHGSELRPISAALIGKKPAVLCTPSDAGPRPEGASPMGQLHIRRTPSSRKRFEQLNDRANEPTPFIKIGPVLITSHGGEVNIMQKNTDEHRKPMA